MNCEKARDLILSDYTDKEISPKVKSEVEKHLQNCKACREFQEILQKNIISPFKDAKEITPDDYLWQRIKEKIEIPARTNKQFDFSIFESLREKLFNRPQPVLAAAFGVIVVFLAIFLTRINVNDKRYVNDYFSEQVEFFTYLNTNGQDIDFGTATEKYFM